jgi:hypothetical protein
VRNGFDKLSAGLGYRHVSYFDEFLHVDRATIKILVRVIVRPKNRPI